MYRICSRVPFGQRKRRDVSVDVLPAEVPVADVHQRTHRPVRQRRKAGDLLRALMRVRLHGLHLDVHRQHVGIGDRVGLLARRDVDALPSEPQHRRRPLGWIAAEVQADGRRNRLPLSARLHVQFDDEIGVRLEAPRQPLRQQRRHLAGRPARGSGRPDTPRSSRSARRTPGRRPRRRSGVTHRSDRCGCSRGERRADCPD